MSGIFKTILSVALLFRLGDGFGFTSGQDEISPKLTSLKLSGNELYGINEAILEMGAVACPRINLHSLSSIKKFISESVLATAPENSPSNGEFIKNYINLLECLEENIPSNQGKVDPSEFKSKMLSEFALSKKRARRDLSTEEEEEEALMTKEGIIEQEIALLEEGKSFDVFFTLLNSISEKACPAGKQPSWDFMISALSEMLHWISRDSSMYKSAQSKLFGKKSLLRELQACDNTWELAKSKNARTRSFVA